MVNGTTFQFKDCALMSIATGRRAMNLRELREALEAITPESVYYHFWGALLRPRFINPDFNNDFAEWAHRGLRDDALAERLSAVDPTDFDNLEDLRREVIDVIERRLEEREMVPWASPDRQFHFLRSQIIVFDTGIVIERPEELAAMIEGSSISSIFYHFIDARRRDPRGVDDFRAWICALGERYGKTCERIAAIDPFFQPLPELRAQLAAALREELEGGGAQ